MARTKKKAKTRSKTASGSRRKASPRSAPRRKTGRRPKSATGGRATEVERRWSEYWQQRTELEEAVAAVREAEQALGTARDLERKRRSAFETAKSSLQTLLEVESPTASAAAARRMLELPPSEPKPAKVADKPTPPKSPVR
jgi:hypothetical protein